jgi:sulfonate transport system permease protein
MSDVLALTKPSGVERQKLRRVAAPRAAAWSGWLVPLALFIVWQAGTSTGWIASSILPAPVDVGRAAYTLTLSGELPRGMAISTLRALAGLAIGGGIGLSFGFANGLSRWSEALTDTTLQMARNLPHLALIPLVILWFGIDEGAKLFLVALGAFFPIYLNTLHGIRSVDPQLIEMGRSYGLDRGQLFRRIIFPGALPSILIGLRYALGVTFLTLIVAETIAANSGIGYLAMQARDFMQTDIVVLAILIYALLGKLADIGVRRLERWLLSWNAAYQRQAAR